MTHDRLPHARSSGAGRATSARRLLRVGSWKIPVIVVASGLSAILHGGLLTASYFVTWSPTPVSNPKVSFARGDQATRIQVRLQPWPDPAEEKEANEETHEDESAAELSAVIVSADKVDAALPPEDATSEDSLRPPVASSEARDMLLEKDSRETNAATVPTVEGVRDDAPANDSTEVARRTQLVEPIHPIEQLLAPRERSEAIDRQQPPAADAAEEVAAPVTEGAVESNAASSQPDGVETGVETLDLPAPKYPSLSRRLGEEGPVLLRVEVLPDGSVGAIEVLHDAGFARLTEAAIAAARRGRFKPATRNRQPIRATVRIPFRFVLRQDVPGRRP